MKGIGDRLSSFPKVLPLPGRDLSRYDALCERVPKLTYEFSIKFVYDDVRYNMNGIAAKRIVRLIYHGGFHSDMPTDLTNNLKQFIVNQDPPLDMISRLPYLESLDIDVRDSRNYGHGNSLRDWCYHFAGTDWLKIHIRQDWKWRDAALIVDYLCIIDSIKAKHLTIELQAVALTKSIVDCLVGMKRLSALRLSEPLLFSDAPLARLAEKCDLTIGNSHHFDRLTNDRDDRSNFVVSADNKSKQRQHDWSASIAGCNFEEVCVNLESKQEAHVLCWKLPRLKKLTVSCARTSAPSYLTWPTGHGLQSLTICGATVNDASIFPTRLVQLSFTNGMQQPCKELARLTDLENLTMEFPCPPDDDNGKGKIIRLAPPATVDLAHLCCPALRRLKIGSPWPRQRTPLIKNIESLRPTLYYLRLTQVRVDGWDWAGIAKKFSALCKLTLHNVEGINFTDLAPITGLANLRKINWRGRGVNHFTFQKFVNPRIHLLRLTELTLLDDTEDFVKTWADRDVVCRVREECTRCSP
jgi:hypothetical protein